MPCVRASLSWLQPVLDRSDAIMTGLGLSGVRRRDVKRLPTFPYTLAACAIAGGLVVMAPPYHTMI